MPIRLLLQIFGAGLIICLLAFTVLGYLSQSGKISVPRISVSNELQPNSPAATSTIVSPLPNAAPQPIRFIFLGDMMFDRHIRQNAQKRGGYSQLLSPAITKLFKNADLVISNLEGPVTDNPSKSVGSAVGSTANYIFTFDPAVISFLYDANVRLVNLGNNHILNFGQGGLAETYTRLEQGDIGFFGATGSEIEQQRWKALEIDGVSFVFINYNQFTPNGFNLALEDLASVRADHDVVVMYTHWGNEYVPENAVLKEQARTFFDKGADLIVGSHPHVVTGKEVVNGKTVYYSLGNFIFDQYFEPAVQKGLIVEAAFDPVQKNFSFTDIPVKLLPNGTTALEDEIL